MKKTIKLISIAMLSAAVAVSASLSVSAAGINNAEQKILDELKTTVTMEGNIKTLPTSYINQAENYFNTVEITEEQANEIISKIESTKTFLTNTGAVNYATLTDAQEDEFISRCKEIAAVVGLKIAYDKATQTVTIIDADGKVIFVAANVGNNGNPYNDNPRQHSSQPGDDTSKPGDDTSKPGGDTSKISPIDDNPIKNTGLDFNIPGVMSVAGTGVFLVSAAGVCLIKRRKSAVSEDV